MGLNLIGYSDYILYLISIQLKNYWSMMNGLSYLRARVDALYSVHQSRKNRFPHIRYQIKKIEGRSQIVNWYRHFIDPTWFPLSDCKIFSFEESPLLPALSEKKKNRREKPGVIWRRYFFSSRLPHNCTWIRRYRIRSPSIFIKNSRRTHLRDICSLAKVPHFAAIICKLALLTFPLFSSRGLRGTRWKLRSCE